jgi:hypothetical protein
MPESGPGRRAAFNRQSACKTRGHNPRKRGDVTRILQSVKAASVFVLLLTPLQAADALTIKSGSFTYESHLGHITLVGTSGLRLQSTVDPSGGVMDLDNQCGFPACDAGTTVVSLGAFWSGLDFTGSLRLRGREYQLGSGDSTAANGQIRFRGTVEIPAAVGSEEIEVSAPFTMIGSLAHDQGADGQPIVESMRGAGTATVRFRPAPFDPSAWQLVSAVYVFD